MINPKAYRMEVLLANSGVRWKESGLTVSLCSFKFCFGAGFFILYGWFGKQADSFVRDVMIKDHAKQHKMVEFT